ncbi:uncharacterized protein LOC115416196 isoform X1 [Sphaeramia orbicularis]|uniref:uncharacterized protein LOC115416196 isoform X1 n=2 Tax=Sphaeramia orbicularis TaxID=375764 RepID=UPI00117F7931|nr:uncharacterized protein LOC115416196 isoform X1 [Sphaeramia orbicularis]XP_029985782.1 uncharacterized protein LOC115416196 isoform X1 [Sphaeramia orbicularis]
MPQSLSCFSSVSHHASVFVLFLLSFPSCLSVFPVFPQFPIMPQCLSCVSSVSHHASVLVQVSEGGSALLPCSSSKPLSDGAVVEWLRDTPPLTVHIRRSDRDQPSEQDRLYQRRTAMKADAYKSRDLSLTLNDTTIFDKGVYICSVTDGSKLPDQEVELKVHLKDDAISRRLSDLRDAVIVVGVFTGIGFIGGSGYLLYKKYTKGSTRGGNI